MDAVNRSESVSRQQSLTEDISVYRFGCVEHLVTLHGAVEIPEGKESLLSLQEVSELKISKTQLEDQLSRMKQQAALVSKEQEADLLRVIEKQQVYIEEFREKAHQRSTILRTENETLRKEMEFMLDSQEKMKWENQMLETSLKGLQADLTEYIQLQKRFEEVQKEKDKDSDVNKSDK